MEKYFKEEGSRSSNNIRKEITTLLENEAGLNKEDKEKLAEYFSKIRSAVFSDYYFIDYVNDKLKDVLETCSIRLRRL